MSDQERVKIEPDLEFVQDVIDGGGESLKKCFQCGTCSVMCSLAPADSPFPRREMIWAQWGLKDKLMGDPNVWTCFQCSDCSSHCPRGASPGDVMGAVRKKIIESVAFPSFMGRAVGDPHYWATLILFPALVLFGVLIADGVADLTQAPIMYSKMISHIQLNLVFPFFSGLAALAFVMGIEKMWKAGRGESLLTFLPSMDLERMVTAGREVITDILTHKEFDQCGTNKWRKLAHLLVFYAFLGLLLTTVLAIVVLVAADYLHWDKLGEYPMNWYHPIKWLGNGSAAALILGSLLMIKNRSELGDKGDLKSSAFDLFFLYVIFGVGLTGFLAQALRFMAAPPIIAYPTYFIHLVLVFALLIYSPYSKFAHFVYRTVALIQKRYFELEAQQETAGEGVKAEAA